MFKVVRLALGLVAWLCLGGHSQRAQAAADLWIRDDADDVGAEPNILSSKFYLSDDIWVRRQPDPNYDPRPFPTASPTWMPLAHEGPCYRDPKSSSPNYIYVRIRNRGSSASSGNETLHVYWAKASTGLGWPADWNDHLETPSCGGAARLYGYEVTKPRKNGATASAQEKADYVSAIQTIDTAPFSFPGGSTYFDKQNQVHVFVFSGGANEIHQTLKFFPWHREFIGRYEALLREVKPTLTLLYWDWTTDPSPTIIGGAGYMGASSGLVGAPFAGFGVSRNKASGAPSSYDMGLGAAWQTGMTLPSASFSSLWMNLENPSHGNAHCYVGGFGNTLCSGDAAKDPVFFMIHANADRLWAMWQRQNTNRWTPALAYDASQATAEITSDLRPWDGTGSIRPWTLADGYINHKAPTHHSIVYPPIYDDVPLKIPVLQPNQCCIIEIPFYPPPLAECAGFSEPQHLCLLARVETSSTAPYGMTFAEGSTLWQNVKNNNNIAWRNVTLGDCSAGPFFKIAAGRIGAAAEIIRNFRTNAASLTLRFDAVQTGFRNLFDYGYVRLRLDPILLNAWTQGGRQGQGIEAIGTNEVLVLFPGATLSGLLLGAREYGRMDVALELNRNYQDPFGDVYHLDVLQYDDQSGQEPVGGQRYDLDFNLLKLAPKGADWKYLDGGQIVPANWTSINFDDQNWRTGTAPLGYGHTDVATELRGATNGQPATIYFRQSITLPDPTFYRNLALHLLQDDGLIVYLNGQEVARLNMPTGAVDVATRALAPMTGAAARACRSVNIANFLTLLRAGKNVLAAEVHPANSTNQIDLTFDTELAGNVPSFPYQPPTVVITTPENGALYRSGVNVPLLADVLDPDGDLISVRIYGDGALLASPNTPPYSATLQSPSAGAHRFSVEAQDSFGHLTRMESVFTVLSNLIPTVVLTSPTNSAVYPAGASVPFAANVSDPDGVIAQVLFHVMSMSSFNAPHQIVGMRTAPPYQVVASNLPPDYYVAVAQAMDNKGAIGYSSAMEFSVARPTGTPELRFRYQALAGGRVLTLEWDDPTAVLEHSFSIPGNWGTVSDASSPYRLEPVSKTEFFRLRLR